MYKTPKEKLAKKTQITSGGMAALHLHFLASSLYPWSHDLLLLLNPCLQVVDRLDHRSTAKIMDPMFDSAKKSS